MIFRFGEYALGPERQGLTASGTPLKVRPHAHLGAAGTFMALVPSTTLANVAPAIGDNEAKDRDRVIKGLRRAGLPEE